MRTPITLIAAMVMSATALSSAAQTPADEQDPGYQPSAAPAYQQQPGSRQGPGMYPDTADRSEHIERRIRHLNRQLDLSEEQRAEIKAILQEQRGKHARRGNKAEMRVETRDRIAEVLNEEQRAKLEELRAQRLNRRQTGMGSGGGSDSGRASGPSVSN